MKPKPYNSNSFIGWLKILELRNKSPSEKRIDPLVLNNIITMVINLKIYLTNNPNTFKRKKY